MSDVVNPMPGMNVSIRVEGSGLPGGGATGDVLTKTESGAEWKKSKQDIPTSVPQIQTASVGQTVVVKAVDENGKPTEWEAKDVSGGGVVWIEGLDYSSGPLWADGTPVTAKAFVETIASNTIMEDLEGEWDRSAAAMVVGYHINDTTSEVTIVGGNGVKTHNVNFASE